MINDASAIETLNFVNGMDRLTSDLLVRNYNKLGICHGFTRFKF